MGIEGNSDLMVGPVLGPYGLDTQAQAGTITAGASNILTSNNPVFACANFLAVFPQFGGASVAAVLTTTAGSATVSLPLTPGVEPGAVVGDITSTIPDGATVLTSTGTVITLSAPAAAAGSFPVTFYTMMVPVPLMQMFIAMANSSIQKARWHSTWQYAMCLYTAHFCTLYLQTQTSPNSTAGQVVATAQTMFPIASEGAGDVSGGYDTSSILGDMPGWGQFKLTAFGTQLITWGQIVGKGGMCVW